MYPENPWSFVMTSSYGTHMESIGIVNYQPQETEDNDDSDNNNDNSGGLLTYYGTISELQPQF